MKIEPRGKYAGVKVHLDGEEAEVFLDYFRGPKHEPSDEVIKFASRLGKKIDHLIGEMPNLLEDRTEEQIKESLEGDAEKIEAQLAALAKGKDWKQVK